MQVLPEHKGPPQKTSASVSPPHHPGYPQIDLSPQNLQKGGRKEEFSLVSFEQIFCSCICKCPWLTLGGTHEATAFSRKHCPCG